MRIISPFHDYYDSVQAQGQDKDIVFVRKASLAAMDVPGMPWDAHRVEKSGLSQTPTGSLKVSINFRDTPLRHYANPANPSNALNLVRAYVLVGGKAHTVWVVSDYLEAASDREFSRNGAIETWSLGAPGTWGDPDLVHLIETWRAARLLADPTLADRKIKVRVNGGEPKDYPEMLAKPDPWALPRTMLEHERVHAAVLDHNWNDLHVDQETPVLFLKARATATRFTSSDAVPGTTWVVRNPRLADLRMGSVLDAYSAFQDAATFIGGVMPGRTAPLITISDKIQVLKKGFDPKYGFRRRPA